jgi:pilus assembly protein CpaF
MAADLPVDSIRRQIASAVDVIVQLSRLPDGRRAIVQVTEVVGVDQDSQIQMKDIFLRDAEDRSAELTPTGRLPTFMGELIESKLIRLDQFYL